MPTISTFKPRSRRVLASVDGGTPFPLDNSSTLEKSLEKVWSNTADYRTLVRQKKALPENPFTYELYSHIGGRFRQTRTVSYPAGTTTYVASSDFGWSFGSSLSPFPISVRNSAVFRALSKARGNEFSAPLFVKEGRETSSMIVKRATQLVHVATLAKRGQFSAAYREIFGVPPQRRVVQKWNREFGRDGRKAVGSFILETSYGWLPFMSDVRAAVMTFMDALETETSLEFSVSSSANQESWSVGSDTLYSFSNGFFRATASYERKVRNSCRITYRYRLNATSVPARFGLTNVPKFLYDATALSFVVDWFVPIGSYLAQFDDDMRFSFLSGSEGRRQEVLTVTSKPVSDDNESNVEGGGGRTHRILVTRSPLTSLPSVRFTELEFKLDMGFTRAINAIALLQQRWPR